MILRSKFPSDSLERKLQKFLVFPTDQYKRETGMAIPYIQYSLTIAQARHKMQFSKVFAFVVIFFASNVLGFDCMQGNEGEPKTQYQYCEPQGRVERCG